jgi:hypothetical protein
MKAILALAALGLLVLPAAQAIEPGPATINVTIRQVSSQAEGARTIRAFQILNRPAYRKPIGAAVLICNRAATRLFACRMYFRFPRGQITADGLVENLSFYRLAITGGIGYYDTVGGSMIVQEIGGDAWSVVISLQGFG